MRASWSRRDLHAERRYLVTGRPSYSPGSGAAEVLGLVPEGGGLAALIGFPRPGHGASRRHHAQTSLMASWASAGGPSAPSGKWRASAPLALGTGKGLVSFGPTATGGIFALVPSPDGSPGTGRGPKPLLRLAPVAGAAEDDGYRCVPPRRYGRRIDRETHRPDRLGFVPRDHPVGQGSGPERPYPVRVFELMMASLGHLEA